MTQRKKTKISVDIHDFYQLLIAECRYGYYRNNHLMPGGAYTHVKEYLDKMYKVDPEWSVHTAKQICDECISDQLVWNFFNALDDEYGSRREAIQFIEYLLNWIHQYDANYVPYNYSQFEDNLAREESLLYRVYELAEFDSNAEKLRELTTGPVTKKDAEDILFTKELKVTQGLINHIDIKTKEYPVRVVGELIRIIEPESHKGKIYSIELVDPSK